ncbi:MAG: ATP-binding protein [Methanoregulaceae archaeon]|nr:ATP-binding protein [Methanoregulaceae archaeon]
MNILAIEDNPADAAMIRELLSGCSGPSFRVSRAGTLSEAHDILAKGETDFILLDLGLPDSQGLDTLREVRGDAPALPVVVLTGFDDEDLAVRALREGAQDYLVKGRISSESLIHSIRYAKERNRIEQELVQISDNLRRSNKDLEQFAYVASHDLREPLRMVTSFAQLLKERYSGRLDSDADEFIGYIVEGSTRMDALIEDLLEYSRVSSRGNPFMPTDMNSVVSDVITDLSVPIGESGAGIYPAALPTVSADRVQMARVFQNLLANAIKFRGANAPEIRIDATRDEDEWTFSVKDNGIGIDPAYSERIFEIFQRLHGRNEYPGTGIGLAVCRKIVERHGGRIWVEPAEKKGSTFYFTIPCGPGNGVRPGNDRSES